MSARKSDDTRPDRDTDERQSGRQVGERKMVIKMVEVAEQRARAELQNRITAASAELSAACCCCCCCTDIDIDIDVTVGK